MQCGYAILISISSFGLALGQTQVDLSRQTKDVNFTAASATSPFQAGTTLPATCSVGQAFFQTNAAAGLNLYGCTATNSWTLLSAGILLGDVTGAPGTNTVVQIQGRPVSATAPANGQVLGWNATSNSWTPQTAGGAGVAIDLNGTAEGTQATLNFISGTGIVLSCVNNTGASRVDCTPSYNSALIPTHDTIHANESYCASSNGTTAYTCSMPDKALTAYSVGQMFLLNVDTTCATSCSLNIDSNGAKSIKQSNGTTDPGGALIAGQAQLIWYDGTVMRLMY